MITEEELVQAGYEKYDIDEDLYYKDVWNPTGKNLYVINFSCAGRLAVPGYVMANADVIDGNGQYMELVYHGTRDSTIEDVEKFFADKCIKLKV